VSLDESLPPHAAASIEADAASAASFQNFFMLLISLIDGANSDTEQKKP
jgi:hypothetical protein